MSIMIRFPIIRLIFCLLLLFILNIRAMSSDKNKILLVDRIEGMLIASAIADAMAGPFEGRQTKVSQKFLEDGGWIDQFENYTPGFQHYWNVYSRNAQAGTFTDENRLRLLIAEALLEPGGVETEGLEPALVVEVESCAPVDAPGLEIHREIEVHVPDRDLLGPGEGVGIAGDRRRAFPRRLGHRRRAGTPDEGADGEGEHCVADGLVPEGSHVFVSGGRGGRGRVGREADHTPPRGFAGGPLC